MGAYRESDQAFPHAVVSVADKPNMTLDIDLFPDEEDRAVSPVIGVILMVAITVILAAVIGTFVLNLSGSVNEQAGGGATTEVTSGSSEVNVTVTSLSENTDGLKCVGAATKYGSSVGRTMSCADGDAVVAYVNGSSSVENKTILSGIGD